MENRDKAMLLYGIEIFAYGYYYQGMNGAALFCAICAVISGLLIRPFRHLRIHSWTIGLLLAGFLFWQNAGAMALWISAVLTAWLTGLQVRTDETGNTVRTIEKIWLLIAAGMTGAFIFCLALGYTAFQSLQFLGVGALGLLVPMGAVLMEERIRQNSRHHETKKASVSG